MPHMSHSITNVPEEARLQCKYTSATHKEALVSHTVKERIFCRSHLPFCASQNILCLATAWLHGRTL